MNHVFVSFNLALSNLLLWNYGPVHTNPFSFENAYFCIRFRRSSTLMRWKTDTLTHVGFRKRLPRWRLSPVWKGENEGFRKRWRLPRRTKMYRFLIASGRSKTIRKRQCGRGMHQSIPRAWNYSHRKSSICSE